MSNGETTQTSASHTKQVSIALSSIIASVWAGLWGFDWAASHLTSGQLYNAILLGLVFGTAMTLSLGLVAFWVAYQGMKQGDSVVTFQAKKAPTAPHPPS